MIQEIDIGGNVDVECGSMARDSSSREPLTPVQKRIQQAALRLFTEKGVDGVNVKDLAGSARVARGTIYNNQRDSIEKLFQELAGQLSVEMHQRVVATMVDVDDPAQRLAMGIRLFIRRAHEEPEWGAFIVRFGMNNSVLREMLSGPPRKDVSAGVASGRYKVSADQMQTAIVMIASSALGAMYVVLEWKRHWRKTGSDAAEFVLRALGLSAREAHKIATAKLPELALGE